MKSQLAKIELHIFILLKKTNEEFSEEWKKSQNPNNEPNFQNCIQNYQTIRELIEYNRNKKTTSHLLESYYLEAWLGEIQSTLNDLTQNPSYEDVLLSNDEKIEELTKSLNQLNLKAIALNLPAQKNRDKALLKDYQDLFDEISGYFFTWDKTIYERKAVYYYNLAENLINEAGELSEDPVDFDLKKELLSTSIACLDAAHNFYNQYGQHQYANETLQYQKKIEAKLKQLEKIPKSDFKTKKPIKHVPKASTHLKQSLPRHHTESSKRKERTSIVSTLPKKRIHWLDSKGTEGPVHKQLKKKSFMDKPIIKKSIEKEGSFDTYPSSSSLSSHNEEVFVQSREEEFRQIIHQIAFDDPFRFYGQLFFNLNQKLYIYSKESSNHTLLTQLSWLTLSQQLINLIRHKNQKDNQDFSKINHIRKTLLEKHQKNLSVISQQKRNEAYPTYSLADLQSRDLQTLFIDEVFDYYYGLEAFKQTSAALSFLDLSLLIIKNYSFNPLEEIKKAIQSVHTLNESLFFAKLLRELVKFHVCQENIAWQKSTFSSDNKVNLNKEYLRILTIAENFIEQSNKESQDLKTKIKLLKNHLLQQFQPNLIPINHSYSSFFQSFQQSSSIEALIKILQEHFQCLLKYRNPGIHSQAIYKHLVKFIHTHCKEQIQTNPTWTSQTL